MFLLPLSAQADNELLKHLPVFKKRGYIMNTNRLLLVVCCMGVCIVALMGCTYEKHYYGKEEAASEGVVVREHYVVE
jgi:hypothetical protein